MTGALFLAGAVGTEFLPQLDEGVIWIRSNLPPGISLEESAKTAARIRELIRQSPEVQMVMSQTGRNDSGMDPFGPNRNEFLVQPLPYSQWPSGKVERDLVDELSQRLNSRIPGASFNITQPIIDTSTEIATGSSADLAVIISGPNLSTLRGLASEVMDIVKGVDGAADTSIEQEADQTQLRIAVDRGELARYGLNISDVQDVIELAVGGRAVGSVFEGERRFDVTVRYVVGRAHGCGGDRADSGGDAHRRACPARAARARRHGARAKHHRATRKRTTDDRAHEHPRSRPGRVRGRCASQGGLVCPPAVRLPRDLGRAIREPRRARAHVWRSFSRSPS